MFIISKGYYYSKDHTTKVKATTIVNEFISKGFTKEVTYPH